MPNINYIKKKIGQSYLIWFQNTNLYTQLEEPAWFVFWKTVKRYKTETIAGECSVRYGLNFDECLQFVKDIRSNIGKMNQSVEITNITNNHPVELTTKEFKPYSTRRYRLTDNLIEFSVESQQLESYLHPLIGYLETDQSNGKISRFELFEYLDKIVFRLNGTVKGFMAP